MVFAGVLSQAGACMIGILIAALYASIMVDLAKEWWTQPAASYGMLIPPMVAYIAWVRWPSTAAIAAEPAFKGLWLVALGCVMLILGRLAGEFFISRISLVVVLSGLIWTFWGPGRLRNLGFLLILLATMAPLPAIVYNGLAAPLQLIASTVATQVAQALGVSIFRDGNIIYLANISLGVAEACSGLQSLSAMVVASLLLGILEDAVPLGRILLLALSVPLAILVNIIRVTATAIIADYKSDLALGFYHAFAGWVLFLAGFGLLWLTGKLIFHLTRRTR